MFALHVAGADRETDRLEAFSDGVFAFAMTLLVLNLGINLDLSKADPVQLRAALWDLKYEFGALALTFGTVYILWMSHHALFRRVRHIDGLVLFANGLFLFLIATSAIPTRVLAQAVGGSAGNFAAGLYATFFLLVTTSFFLLGQALARSQRRGPNAHTDLQLRQVRRRTSFGFALYLVAAGASFVSKWITLLICALLWAFWGWVAFTRHRHTHTGQDS